LTKNLQTILVLGCRWHVADAGRCPEGQTVTSVNSETPGIFDDLSDDEINAVINYTRQIVCFNVRDDVSSDVGNMSTIGVIELKAPIKHRAIQYLDAAGPAPPRNARVVLYRPVHFTVYTITNTRQSHCCIVRLLCQMMQYTILNVAEE